MNLSVTFIQRDRRSRLVVGAVGAGVEVGLCLRFSRDILQAERDGDLVLSGVQLVAACARGCENLARARVDHIPFEGHVSESRSRDLCELGGRLERRHIHARDLEAVLAATHLRAFERRRARRRRRRRGRRGVGIFRRRLRIRIFRRLWLLGRIDDRLGRFLAENLFRAVALVVTVVAARRVGLTLERRAATTGVFRVVATYFGLIGIRARGPSTPVTLRTADTRLIPVAALSAGLGFLIVDAAQTFVSTGTTRFPREVRAAPFLDTTLATRDALFRTGTLAGRTHRTVVSGGTGGRALHHFARLENGLTLLEILPQHVELRIEVRVAEWRTEDVDAHGGHVVRLPEFSVDEESLEVVVGVLEDDGTVAERASFEHLDAVP